MVQDINFSKKEDSFYFNQAFSKKDISELKNFDGFFIDADENECRKIVESLKNSGKKIAIKARDEIFNRRVLETLNFDYLVSLEINKGKDTLKQRSSGLNHVVAKIAAKKNIAIVVSLQDLFNFTGKELSVYISKIIQNIKICRKAKCDMKIASFSKKQTYSTKERQRLGVSWGMSSQQAKATVSF